MEYIQRLHHFRSTRTWYLTEDHIGWSDEDGVTSQIQYRNINKVRMRYEPSRFETNRFSLIFYSPAEHKITNIHYNGVMDFADQSKDFVPFVRAFHEKLSTANARTRYSAGSTNTAYVMNILLTAFILFTLLAVGFYLINIGFIAIATAKFVLILVFLPVIFSLLKKNKPRTYDPRNIPPDILPE